MESRVANHPFGAFPVSYLGRLYATGANIQRLQYTFFRIARNSNNRTSSGKLCSPNQILKTLRGNRPMLLVQYDEIKAG